MNKMNNLTYCERCECFSDNIAIHNCRLGFMADVGEAYRDGDHAKVNKIVAFALSKGIDLTKSEQEISSKRCQ